MSDHRLEINLSQGLTKGISIAFETASHSMKLLKKKAPVQLFNQVHGLEICDLRASVVDYEKPYDGFCGDFAWLRSYQGALAIQTADCAPLFFIDYENELFAGVHAGWRGLAQKIHLLPFQHLGFNPLTSWVWLGPSLNGDYFEVKQDMKNQFDSLYQEDSQLFYSKEDRSYFSPWLLLEKDFAKQKVPVFYNAEENTYEHLSYFSYRRSTHKKIELKKSYRNISWISAVDDFFETHIY